MTATWYDFDIILFVYIIGMFTGLLANKAYRELLNRVFNKLLGGKKVDAKRENIVQGTIVQEKV